MTALRSPLTGPSVVIALLCLLLTPAPAQALTPSSPAAHDDDPVEGLICYWSCMTLCLLVGKQHDGCHDTCTETCFTVINPPGPTCEPEDPGACQPPLPSPPSAREAVST